MVTKYVGAQLDVGDDPVSGTDDVVVVEQMDGADVGRKIFVQFTGDTAPAGMVRGDILIKET